MLKYLAIFAVLFAASLYVSVQDKDSAERSAQQAAHCSGAVSGKADKYVSQNDVENAERNSPSWYKFVRWPNGIGALAVILTLLAIAEQTQETRKAADAGAKAAEAALLNAQAVINAERPWLLVSVQSPIGPMGGFTIHARNRGRTPALITGAYLGCAAGKDVSVLPREAPYGPASLMKDRIVPPGGKVFIWWFDTTLFQHALKEGIPHFPWEGDTFVFGKVLYRNLANPAASEHETRWIGMYQRPVGEEGNSIFRIQGIGIPEEYDRHT